jgi:hypothetical protein
LPTTALASTRTSQSVGYGFVNFISATWLLVFVKDLFAVPMVAADNINSKHR